MVDTITTTQIRAWTVGSVISFPDGAEPEAARGAAPGTTSRATARLVAASLEQAITWAAPAQGTGMHAQREGTAPPIFSDRRLVRGHARVGTTASQGPRPADLRAGCAMLGGIRVGGQARLIALAP